MSIRSIGETNVVRREAGIADGEPTRGVIGELLAKDHRRLDGLLAEAKVYLAAGWVGSAAARFTEFRHGLEHHFDLEERVLFPALERSLGGAPYALTRVMRAEHAEIRVLLCRVAAALALADGRRTMPLASLTARIYAHNGKEERILYPALGRAALSESLAVAITQALRPR